MATSFQNPILQTKLTTPSRIDPFEREADQVANRLVGNNPAHMQPLTSGIAKVQAKTKEASDTMAARPVESQLRRSGAGQQLPEGTLQQMNRSFNADFREVRIHTDPQATQMNETLQAHAFTYGKDVYFNAGQFRPESTEGQHLLAHELTHVLQQKGNGQGAGNSVIQKASKKKCEDLANYPELTMPSVVAAIAAAWELSTKNDKFTSEDLAAYNDTREKAYDECLNQEGAGSLEDCPNYAPESSEGRGNLMGSRYRESGFNVFADGSVSAITKADLPWKVSIPNAADAIAIFHTHPPQQRMYEGGVSPEDAAALERVGATKRLYVINRDNIELLGNGKTGTAVIATFQRKDLEKCL